MDRNGRYEQECLQLPFCDARDIVLFNPGDNHACVQSDNGTLDYKGFNISKEITIYLRPLHEMVMNRRN